MGLDTTHGAWHGPYSAFNRFRREIARRIGIDLDEYYGYNPNGTKDLSTIVHPIAPLLNKEGGDCEGHLTPAQCLQIAEGLNDIMMNGIQLEEMDNGTVQLFFQDCEIFRKGCLLAAQRRENLEFH